MSNTPDFINQVAPGSGTALDASHLDALVVAQSYLVNGTAPAASGLATALSVPTQQVAINAANGTAVYYSVTGAVPTGSVTVTTTNYIDAASDGSGFVWSTAGSPSGTNLRLYAVAVNGGGSVTSVTLRASTAPIGQAQVQTGANGIATTNASSLVIQAAQTGVRQTGTLVINLISLAGVLPEAFVGYNAGTDPWSNGTASLCGFVRSTNATLAGTMLSWGNNWTGTNPTSGGGHTGYVAQHLTFTTSGGTVRVDMSASVYNFYGGGSNWVHLFGLLDATGAGGSGSPAWYAVDNVGSPQSYTSNAPALSANGYGTLRGSIVFTGLAAGTHTFIPLLNAGGPSGNCVAGFQSVTDVNRSYFSLIVSEIN